MPVSGSWREALPGVRRRGFREGRECWEALRRISWVVSLMGVGRKAGSSMVVVENGGDVEEKFLWRGRNFRWDAAPLEVSETTTFAYRDFQSYSSLSVF